MNYKYNGNKIPVVDGIELLYKIKNNVKSRNIPIIMLTTTDDPEEINKCYNLGCSIYITKSVNIDQLMEKLNRIGLFIEIITT